MEMKKYFENRIETLQNKRTELKNGIENLSAEEIKEYALANLGMDSLKASAMKLVEEGTTTVAELARVAYYD